MTSPSFLSTRWTGACGAALWQEECGSSPHLADWLRITKGRGTDTDGRCRRERQALQREDHGLYRQVSLSLNCGSATFWLCDWESEFRGSFWGTSFFPGITGYLGLILGMSGPRPRICHLSEEPVGLPSSFVGQDQGSLQSPAFPTPTITLLTKIPTCLAGNTSYSVLCRASDTVLFLSCGSFLSCWQLPRTTC